MNALDKIKSLYKRSHYGETFFYLAASGESTEVIFNTLKNTFGDEIWWEVSAGDVASVTFVNGTEITILPTSDAGELLSLPPSNYIFIETTHNIKDLISLLTPYTDTIVVVDANTKELL